MLKIKFYVLSILLVFGVHVNSQPTINKRYTLNDETSSVFSTVLVIDNELAISGYQTSIVGFSNHQSSLANINFSGDLEANSVFSNDSLGLSFMYSSRMIMTLDSSLAHIALAASFDFPYSYMFVKMSKTGEHLITNYLPEFYTEDLNNGKNPSTLIQSVDSTYYGIVHVQHEESLLGGITFYRLDKEGNLMYKKTYYGDRILGYNTLRSASMVQLNDTELMIGCAYRKDAHETSEVRHHTRLMKIDTLGELLEEHTYYEDDLSYDCNSLTRTADGGFLYGGRIGLYYPEYDGILYKSRVVKLNEDYSVAWEIPYGDYYTSGFAKNFTKILPLNEREFVVTGYVHTETGIMGCLVKFNIDGELLWHRKYMKVPLRNRVMNITYTTLNKPQTAVL